ncbi:YkgJ family cysteine cluster protein [Geotalea sp. SG265]|uniref:YkgJ family cysteine cluster protein n=1 Tax=Geotalea sp. SG265 TaxID=2922867 RepID=UPI001FAEC356|nr:YkgJ family cysteine cluster protein [Geotalea sp. SG265]
MEIANILQLYGQLLTSVDQWFARCMAAAPDDIRCGRGCSECCRGLFDITLLDACYLKSGFDRLSEEVKDMVLEKAIKRLNGVKAIWPEFNLPFILNHRPDAEWDAVMPDEDDTPCVLLDDHGQCLVYEHRPMTCRLHGIPLIDSGGEVIDEDGCSLNFTGMTAILPAELRFPFIELFQDETTLFKLFTKQLLKQSFSELDTLIPAAVLLSFDHAHWRQWRGRLLSNIEN